MKNKIFLPENLASKSEDPKSFIDLNFYHKAEILYQS